MGKIYDYLTHRGTNRFWMDFYEGAVGTVKMIGFIALFAIINLTPILIVVLTMRGWVLVFYIPAAIIDGGLLNTIFK